VSLVKNLVIKRLRTITVSRVGGERRGSAYWGGEKKHLAS